MEHPTNPEEIEYLRQRDDAIREASKRGESPVDLAETYQISEADVLKIIKNRLKRPRRRRLDLAKCSTKSIDKIYDKILVMRMKGFSNVYISDTLQIAYPDIKAIIQEFNIPSGFRCEDCDIQVVLEKPSPRRKLCTSCADKRDDIASVRAVRERYRNDPVFRASVLEAARQRANKLKF